jgi:hypothetical protein
MTPSGRFGMKENDALHCILMRGDLADSDDRFRGSLRAKSRRVLQESFYKDFCAVDSGRGLG